MAIKNITAFRLQTRIEVDATKAHAEFKAVEGEVKRVGDQFTKTGKQVADAFKGAEVGKKFGKDFGTAAVASITGSIQNIGQTIGALMGTAIAPGLGTAVGSTIGSGIDTALQKVQGPMMQLIGQGVELNKLLEETRYEFKTMVGSELEANKYLDELLKISKDIGILPATVIETSERLSDLTGDLKLTRLALKAAADQAADFGGADTFQKVADALGLIAERGQLIERDFKGLLKVGVQAQRYLLEASGLTEKQLTKLIAAGRIRGDVAARIISLGIEREKGGFAAARTGATVAGRERQFGVQMQLLSAQGTQNLTRGEGDLYARLNAILASPQATKVVDFVDKMSGYVVNLTESAVKKAASVGGGIAEGLLSYDPAAMMQSFTNLAGFMETGLKTVFRIQSPSQWAIEKIGIPIGQGIAQGIKVGFVEAGSDLERAFVRILSGDLRGKLDQAAKDYGIPVELLAALIAQESRGNPHAVSPKGAKGLGQFIPSTAAAYGILGREFDPAASIDASAHLLSDLLKQFSGDVPQALAHYNWSGRGQMPQETKDYVRLITGLLGSQQPGSTTATAGGTQPDRPGYRAEDVYPEIDRYRNQITRLNEKSAQIFETLQFYNKELGEAANTVRQQELRDEYAKNTQLVEELNRQLFDFIKSKQTGAGVALENARFNSGVWTRYLQNLLGATGTPLATLNPELPKLDESLTTLSVDVRELNYQSRAAHPELGAMQQRIALFGLGMPPIMKGVNDAQRELGTSSEDLARQMKEAWRQADIGIDTIGRVAGAFGQISSMLPQQEVGKKRGFFSKLLGFAAPFLSFIPGVGPLLSTIAGSASSIVGGNYGAGLSTIAGGFSHTYSQGGFRRGGSTTSSTGSSGHGRAFGGPVRAGTSYVVGEYRPELFVPERNGYVHPSVPGGELHPAVLSVLSELSAEIGRLRSFPADHIVSTGAHGLLRGMDRNAALTEGLGRRMRLA